MLGQVVGIHVKHGWHDIFLNIKSCCCWVFGGSKTAYSSFSKEKIQTNKPIWEYHYSTVSWQNKKMYDRIKFNVLGHVVCFEPKQNWKGEHIHLDKIVIEAMFPHSPMPPRTQIKIASTRANWK